MATVITKKILAYTFDELSDDAKNKARVDLCPDDDWYKDSFAQFTEDLEKIGYTNIQIEFSGFWSQGDGASFTGLVDIAHWLVDAGLDQEFPHYFHWFGDWQAETYIEIKRINHHYAHERTVIAEYPDRFAIETPELIAEVDRLEKLILEDVRERSRQIYRDLAEEYEYIMSDEYLTDLCQANNWLFDKYGRIV